VYAIRPAIPGGRSAGEKLRFSLITPLHPIELHQHSEIIKSLSSNHPTKKEAHSNKSKEIAQIIKAA